jgi:hypothetical protein
MKELFEHARRRKARALPWAGLLYRGAQNQVMAQRPIDIPTHVGPCEFGQFGNQIAVRCPKELAHILQRAGAQWEPGSRRWLVQRRRVGPVIRALERANLQSRPSLRRQQRYALDTRGGIGTCRI